MAREFTDEDRELPVRTAEGEEVGTVSEVNEGLADDTRTGLGWEESAGGPYDLRDEQIDRIGEDEVRLRPFESGSESETGP